MGRVVSATTNRRSGVSLGNDPLAYAGLVASRGTQYGGGQVYAPTDGGGSTGVGEATGTGMGLNVGGPFTSRVISTRSVAPRTSSMGTPTQASGGGDWSGLIAQMQASQDAANRAGQEQYGALMNSVSNTEQQVGGLYDQSLKSLRNVKQAGLNRIAQNQAMQRGQTEQDLTSRGLGNTTIRNNMLSGVDRNAELAQQDLRAGLAGQRSAIRQNKAQALAGLGGLRADAILSRQNVGPDMNMYMNSLARYGR